LNIYFVRHAQSVANLKRLYCGVTDIELSEHGENSLSHVGEFFREKNISNIYISPLKRCRRTAELIFGDRDFIVNDGVIEVNFGDWEGLHISEIEDKYADEWNQFLKDWREFTFPNGDNIPKYQKKAGQVIQGIIDKEQDGDIVIVSHNAYIKAAISYLLTGDNKLAYSLSVQNASINQVEVFEDFAKLKLLNY